jgi:tryptophan synthase alpha chain
MSRLAQTFAGPRRRGARALIPYFAAGDPSLDVTRQLVLEAARRGADVVELGVPFSDPLADGPVIQRASQRALAAGVSLARVLELAREVRGDVTIPIVLLTYYNPVHAFGLKAFAHGAVEAGVDGVIVADLPPEEAGPLAAEAQAAGLDLIHLVGGTSGSAAPAGSHRRRPAPRVLSPRAERRRRRPRVEPARIPPSPARGR